MNHERTSLKGGVDMSIQQKRWPITWGIVWSLLFALMSFYWASGGKLGVHTLGPEISRQADLRDGGFILIVWLTGVAKVAGAVLLLALKIKWNSVLLQAAFRIAAMVGGVLLVLYGLFNFVAVLLVLAQVLDLPAIDSYSAWWRLFFWEPFWMLGGLLYFLPAGRRELVTLPAGMGQVRFANELTNTPFFKSIVFIGIPYLHH